MGKMLNVLFVVFLIELSVALFITGCISPGEGVKCEDKTSLFIWLLSPQDWSFSTLLTTMIQDVFLIGGLTAIAVGSLIWKNEFLIYAGITGTLFGFGQTTFRLWQEIRNIPFFDDATGSIMATILLGGLFVYVFITMLDFARGRD